MKPKLAQSLQFDPILPRTQDPCQIRDKSKTIPEPFQKPLDYKRLAKSRGAKQK